MYFPKNVKEKTLISWLISWYLMEYSAEIKNGARYLDF